MVVGILSDTHGDARITSQAVGLLSDAGAEVLFHCGDVGGEAVFDQLVGWRCWFVFGNTDCPTVPLCAYLKSVELQQMDQEKGVELAGQRIGMWHGHERGFLPAVASGRFDYVFYGHTHVKNDRRRGQTRVINPGALRRARVKTVATLDLETDVLEYIAVAGR